MKVVTTSVKLFVLKTIQLDHHILCLQWTMVPSSQTKKFACPSLIIIQNHGTQLGLLLISLWVAFLSGWVTKRQLDLFTAMIKMTNTIIDKKLLGNQETLFLPMKNSKNVLDSTSHLLVLKNKKKSKLGLLLLKKKLTKKKPKLKLELADLVAGCPKLKIKWKGLLLLLLIRVQIPIWKPLKQS